MRKSIKKNQPISREEKKSSSLVFRKKSKKNFFPSRRFFEFYEEVRCSGGRQILCTRHAWGVPQIWNNLRDLFLSVLRDQTTCYWIAIEPFKFFMDLDFYRHPYCAVSIDSVLKIVSSQFNQFLVCQSPDKNKKSSFSIFTDKICTYKEAEDLEMRLIDEISSLHDDFGCFDCISTFSKEKFKVKRTVLDCMYKSTAPYTYRRAPYSLHGYCFDRRSIPRKDLSRINGLESDFQMFEFSYPNLLKI